MFSDVESRIKRKNKILFSHDSQCLKSLFDLVMQQSHKVLIMWALDGATSILPQLETKYIGETRFSECIELSERWATGDIKMKHAKQAILDVHAIAKTLDDQEMVALCHAIGQACSTVHVKTHAIGLVLYELTSIVLKYDKAHYQEAVIDKINDYHQKLIYWSNNPNVEQRIWAKFL